CALIVTGCPGLESGTVSLSCARQPSAAANATTAIFVMLLSLPDPDISVQCFESQFGSALAHPQVCELILSVNPLSPVLRCRGLRRHCRRSKIRIRRAVECLHTHIRR